MNEKEKQKEAWKGICNAVNACNDDMEEFQRRCDRLA
jgi:hypothetical protein